MRSVYVLVVSVWAVGFAVAADPPHQVPAPAVEGGKVVLVPRSNMRTSPNAKRAMLPAAYAAEPVAPVNAPAAPVTWDFSKAHTVSFPMMGNDRYGNCYYVAICKLFMAYSVNVTGVPVTFDLQPLVNRYFQLSGGDNGLNDVDVFPELRNGVIGPKGPHKVYDILIVDPRNEKLVAVTALFGPHLWTASLPDVWISTARPGATWDVARANPRNGHAMLISGKNGDKTYNTETWGLNPPVKVTQAGVNGADSEFVSCFSAEWFDGAGYAPNGYHYTELAPLWESIGGAKLPASPYPAPKPVPGPVPNPPTPMPADLVLTAADLNASGLAKLKAAGLANFTLDLQWAAKSAPGAAQASPVPSELPAAYTVPSLFNGGGCPGGVCPRR